jgi:hypothetical protein
MIYVTCQEREKMEIKHTKLMTIQLLLAATRHKKSLIF